MTDLDRSARLMGVLTVVSRASGFARVAVFALVFGRTYLANTYASSNTVPNILFELFAAGALQAVLVPSLVRALADRDDAERLAGSVLGVVSAFLAALGVAAALAGPALMGLLVGDVRSAAVRQAEIELGALFLWFFAPQLACYGANVVATAVLNARQRFALPVFAPTLNNVVVIAAYLWFDAVHDGPLTLDLTAGETWIVAGGTTLGVVVFCALPVAAVWRDGFRLRPRLDVRHPALGRLAREGAWAGVFLAVAQVVQVVVLRVANREPGAPTAYQFAFIFFTLPHALFSVPVMTTRFPEMSRAAHDGDWPAYRRSVATAVRSITFLALGATAVSVAVARPAAEVVAFGRGAGLAPRIGEATMAFAPGIVGFGLMLLFTRALYAVGDARTPALVNLAVSAVTAAVMLTVVAGLDDRHLVTGLAAAFAAGTLTGAAALGAVVRREVVRREVVRRAVASPGVEMGLGLGLPVARAVAAGAVASAAGWSVTHAIGVDGRSVAAMAVAAGSAAAVVVYLAGQALLGGPTPRQALATTGAGVVA